GMGVADGATEVGKEGTRARFGEAPAVSGDLFPRLHVASNGLVYTTGSLRQTWSLDISGGGNWNTVSTGWNNGQRDYAPSVLYDVDKVIYIGGGRAPPPPPAPRCIRQAQPTRPPPPPPALSPPHPKHTTPPPPTLPPHTPPPP